VVPNGKTKGDKNQGKIMSQTGPNVLNCSTKGKSIFLQYKETHAALIGNGDGAGITFQPIRIPLPV